MSGAVLNVSKKLPDGTLIAIGGNDAEDFLNNVAILAGDDAVDAVKAEIAAALVGRGVVVTTPAVVVTEQQAVANLQAAGATVQQHQPAQQHQAPLCPTHERPAQWREGGISTKTQQPYDGFWKCATTGNGIHLRNGALKRSCG